MDDLKFGVFLGTLLGLFVALMVCIVVDIGFVWSRRGFSYRGTQGWNSGVRIRDYHPIEWHFSFTLIEMPAQWSWGRYSREAAVEALIAAHWKLKSAPQPAG